MPSTTSHRRIRRSRSLARRGTSTCRRGSSASERRRVWREPGTIGSHNAEPREMTTARLRREGIVSACHGEYRILPLLCCVARAVCTTFTVSSLAPCVSARPTHNYPSNASPESNDAEESNFVMAIFPWCLSGHRSYGHGVRCLVCRRKSEGALTGGKVCQRQCESGWHDLPSCEWRPSARGGELAWGIQSNAARCTLSTPASRLACDRNRGAHLRSS